MNTCPQCHSVYAEDFVYCLNDGTVLAVADGEQETVLRPRMEAMPVSGPRVACSGCGYDNRAGSKFCKKCGGAIRPAAAEPAVPQFGFAAAAAAPSFAARPAGDQYQPTVTVTPGLFTPPRSDAVNNGRSGADRMPYVFYAGIGGAVVLILVIGGVLLMSKNSSSTGSNNSFVDSKRSADTGAKLPSTFTDRRYAGTVGGGKNLTMTLTRNGNDMTGAATTDRYDTLTGKIDGNDDFDLEGLENGTRHTGYWTGHMSNDGSINGQWTNLRGGKATNFSLQEQQ